MPIESRRWYPVLVLAFTTALYIAVAWWDMFYPRLIGSGDLVIVDSVNAWSYTSFLWFGGVLGCLVGAYLAGRRPPILRVVLATLCVGLFCCIVPFSIWRPNPPRRFDFLGASDAQVLAASQAEDDRQSDLGDQWLLIASGAPVLYLLVTSSLVSRRIVRKSSEEGPPRTRWSL